MRIYLVILILFFSLHSFTVYAEDVILGRIESLNAEKGELRILLSGYGGKSQESETLLVTVDPEKTDISDFEKGGFVRIWGNFAEDSSGIFEARSLSSGGMRGLKNDPTGVRSRLGRGRGAFGRGNHSRGRGRH